jgi:hypothetical protein
MARASRVLGPYRKVQRSHSVHWLMPRGKAFVGMRRRAV